MTSWLPPIAELDGEWEPYCDELFRVFKRDIHAARFHGKRVSRRRMPEVAGKPDGFWHVTSEAFEKDSEERIPDMRRCERVPWIGPMINAAGSGRVLCWKSDRSARNGHNVVIALPTFEYAVILGNRRSRDGDEYMLLVTAFPPASRRQLEFRRAYEAAGEYSP